MDMYGMHTLPHVREKQAARALVHLLALGAQMHRMSRQVTRDSSSKYARMFAGKTSRFVSM